jgi:hypothetical protein
MVHLALDNPPHKHVNNLAKEILMNAGGKTLGANLYARDLINTLFHTANSVLTIAFELAVFKITPKSYMRTLSFPQFGSP